jgi:hypothetical protein
MCQVSPGRPMSHINPPVCDSPGCPMSHMNPPVCDSPGCPVSHMNPPVCDSPGCPISHINPPVCDSPGCPMSHINPPVCDSLCSVLHPVGLVDGWSSCQMAPPEALQPDSHRHRLQHCKQLLPDQPANATLSLADPVALPVQHVGQ